MERTGNERSEKKKKKKWLLLLLLLLFISLIVGGTLFFKQEKLNLFEFDKNSSKYKGNIKIPDNWSKEKIAFPGYGLVSVLEGSDTLHMALMNPDFNIANMKYSLYLDGSSNKFFETGLIKPGEAVTEYPLPSDLSVGEHEVVLHMQAFSPDEKQTELNGARTNFKLVVVEKESEG